jgi:hypothetical protein
MQGSWVSAPNLSSGPMPLQNYDSMGNYIGVPLRYADRNGREISASVFSKTNNDLTIKLDPLSNNEFLTMKKRKDDFNNNFKTPEPFKPINTFKPFIPEIKPFVPIKMDTFEPIDTYKPFIPKAKPFEFIKIEPTPIIDLDSFKPKRKSFYDPVSGLNNF